jgi:quinoprotein relay system zinc metallohydrolase 1
MKLSRRGVLGGIAGTLAVQAVPKVWATPLSYDLRPQAVADGIWMVEGVREYFSQANGGAIVNCVMLETGNGMLIVDTGPSLRFGEALKSAALQLTGRGISGVINTHHHPDHFFGNQVFADLPIRALAQTGSLALANGDAYSDNMYALLGDWMRGTEPVPPTLSIVPGEFEVGGRTLKALPLAGHSEADLALVDLKTGTLIAGDLAFLDRAPTTPSADIGKWRDSLDFLSGVEAAAIIPGHGPVDRSGQSIVQTRAYIDWLETTLKSAAREGLDMIEIMDLPLPDAFATMGAQPQEFHRSVVHLYPDIEKQLLPLAQ